MANKINKMCPWKQEAHKTINSESIIHSDCNEGLYALPYIYAELNFQLYLKTQHSFEVWGDFK